MRLWSLHPKYLDRQGLVAVWREGLLARAVLRGLTRGYRRHPQLDRFRGARRPVAAIDAYLAAIWREAERRGYRFDRSKLGASRARLRLPVTDGQVRFEWAHLRSKLRRRSNVHYQAVRRIAIPAVHPLFELTPGQIEAWERALPARRRRRHESAGSGRVPRSRTRAAAAKHSRADPVDRAVASRPTVPRDRRTAGKIRGGGT